MIGHSRAGKTSFMAGMYKFLGDSNDGYGIRAKDKTQKAQLERLSSLLDNSVYPKGTDIQSEYKFELTVHGEDLIPFNWFDYRGGALMCENEDDSELDDLTSKIQDADALIVFLDGLKLQNHKSDYELEYQVITTCIEAALTKNRDVVFPISFVVTKVDILEPNKLLNGLDFFAPLFDQISASSTVEGIILHSVINKDLYIDPFFALLFSLYWGSVIYMQKRYKYMTKAQKQMEVHTPNVLEDLLRWGSKKVGEIIDEDLSWETETDKYNKAEQNFQYEKLKLEELESRRNEMNEKLVQFLEDKHIAARF